MTDRRFWCWVILQQKNYSSTPTMCWKLSRAFGIHPDPFSGDVCCYFQPCYHEAAKLFYKFGENCSPDHGNWLGQNEAANNSKHHHWLRDLDGFQRLFYTFKKLLVLNNNNIFFWNVDQLPRKLWNISTQMQLFQDPKHHIKTESLLSH